MRKIFASEMITLDGFLAGPNGEIDWHNVDDEFNAYAIEMLGTVDAFFMGRVTYELMASYWPTPAALTDDPVVAAAMNAGEKIVFSRTLAKAEWHNSRLVREKTAEEIMKIKQQPGKDIALFGSGTILSALMRLNLMDEVRIFVNPVVLGRGIPLFKDVNSRHNLKLLDSRAFASGNVLLRYRPA